MTSRHKLPVLFVVVFFHLLATTPPCVAQSAPLSRLFSVVGDYPLGAAVNRTDYESIDADARRLYLSKMGGGQLVVFDIEHNTLIAQLDGFPKITGVLAVPELHKVYASVPGSGVGAALSVGLGMMGLSSGHGAVAIRDTRDLKGLAHVAAGVFPDGIAYDPKERRIFVSDELGSAVTVIDADTNKFLARIETGGEVGNVRYDPATARIFVPVQSNNELIAIDPVRLAVVARHKLPACDHPHGFIVAPGGAVGYAACDGNDRLATVDLRSGRVLGAQPVAHDPDVLAIDEGLHRLYAAAESGNLSIYDIADPRVPAPLGNVFVADEAHAVAVDPISHRLYFGLANVGGSSILKVLAPKPEGSR